MQAMQPFMTIADFETYTNKLNQIKPYSFAMFTHCIFNENNNKLTNYTGEDCLDEFFNDLTYHVNRISKIKAKPNPYSNPDVYKSNVENTICLICNNPILTNNPQTYRYYCKKSGYLYGFRHECHERKLQINVLFHNGARFDFRLIIEYLASKCTHSNISCIAHSMETFLTFSITNFNGTGINLRFIDSYKHLTYPLDSLFNYLLNKDTNTQSIKTKFSSLFQHFNDKAVKLLRKGMFPYDYMDEDWENKLKEKKLPDIKYFHSSLNKTKCPTYGYNYAQEVYKYFNCKEITDYSDLYVKTDVLLLADVFTSYRKNMHEIYGLDPLYCISAPGFSNRAMLKITNIEIKLITSVDMHLIIQDGIRVGKCELIYYHAKASNKYVSPDFNKDNEKESYIISLDANSFMH